MCSVLYFVFKTDLFWLNQLKLHATSCPSNEVTIGRVIKKCDQKLPELQRSTTLVR